MASDTKIFVLTLTLFAVVLSATSSNLKDLQNKFKTDQTAVYFKQKIIGENLEPTVKEFYRKFLWVASLAQKDRIDSYFNEWRIVEDVDGPFANTEQQNKALDSVMRPTDFHASLFMEQLLENREDSKETIAIFQETMISPDTVKLQVYFSGDGDIINSVIVASLKNNGDLYVITSIFD